MADAEKYINLVKRKCRKDPSTLGHQCYHVVLPMLPAYLSPAVAYGQAKQLPCYRSVTAYRKQEVRSLRSKFLNAHGRI